MYGNEINENTNFYMVARQNIIYSFYLFIHSFIHLFTHSQALLYLLQNLNKTNKTSVPLY